MEDHFHSCSACREFAYGESLTHLLTLQRSHEGDQPQLSNRFFADLKRKLQLVDHQERTIPFFETLAQKGWKLAPLMTALIIFLAATLAYQYNTLFSMNMSTSFDDILFSQDVFLTQNDVLSAILSEETDNGK